MNRVTFIFHFSLFTLHSAAGDSSFSIPQVTPFYFTKLTPVYYLRNFSYNCYFFSSSCTACLSVGFRVGRGWEIMGSYGENHGELWGKIRGFTGKIYGEFYEIILGFSDSFRGLFLRFSQGDFWGQLKKICRFVIVFLAIYQRNFVYLSRRFRYIVVFHPCFLRIFYGSSTSILRIFYGKYP